MVGQPLVDRLRGALAVALELSPPCRASRTPT
jgi:hypothetical protein